MTRCSPRHALRRRRHRVPHGSPRPGSGRGEATRGVRLESLFTRPRESGDGSLRTGCGPRLPSHRRTVASGRLWTRPMRPSPKDLRGTKRSGRSSARYLTNARQLAAALSRPLRPSTGRIDFGLPVEHLPSLRAIAEQQRLVARSYRAWLIASPDQAQPRRWWRTRVGRCQRSPALARASTSQVLAAQPAVSTLHVTYADPGTVVEPRRHHRLVERPPLHARGAAGQGDPRLAAGRRIQPGDRGLRAQLSVAEVELLRPAPAPRIVNLGSRAHAGPSRRVLSVGRRSTRRRGG